MSETHDRKESNVIELKENGRATPPMNPKAHTETRTRHPLVELVMARLREFQREPEVVFWVFLFPVLLTVALGIAFGSAEPEPTRIAIEAADTARGTPGGRAADLAKQLEQSPEIDALIMQPDEASSALRSGQVALVVRLVDSAQTSSNANAPPGFAYRFDPTRPDSRTARLIVDDALQRTQGRSDIFSASDEKVSEPGARYIDFLVPGLLGMNLMGSGMWGLGFSIVQARNRKLLKRLAATPMRRSHYLLSFMASRLVMLLPEVGIVIGAAYLIFGVEIHGSFAALTLVTLLGAMMFAGIGLLVAARPTTIEGVSGVMNAVMMPMWLFSGTFFSAARFPDFLQPFIQALPLTALNDALRGVMNEGASLGSIGGELGIMAAYSVVSFVLALKWFRWQ